MAEVFREDQQLAPFPLALLAGMALIEICLAVGVPGLLRAVRIILWILAGLFLLAAWLLRRLTIRVTADYLIFGFGPFRKRVRRAEIASVRIVEATITTTGIGVHRLAGGLWAWVARTGPAVEVLLIPGKAPGYIISTSRPRDLKAALLPGNRPQSGAGK